MSVEFLSQAGRQAAGPPVAQSETREPIPVVRRSRRLWLRSLTSKLVAGVTALVVVLVAAIGTATYFSLSSFLYNRLDQQVENVLNGNARVVTFDCFLTQQGCPQSGTYHSPSVEWITVLSSSGEPVLNLGGNSTQVRLMELTQSQRTAVLAAPSQFRTVTTTDGQELRIVALATQTSNRDTVFVAAGLSTGDVERTLHRLVNLELIIGAAATMLAFLFTSWGVQRSLRNLYKVTGTAREVTAELSPEGAGLDRRVPIVEEGTEVGQLAYSVNTLLSAVETQFAARVESERRMRQFLADASHELRTPLTSIRGFAELARMQRAVGESSEDNLDRIESEGTRMSRLVEDLLILARGDDVDHAPPARDPVDVPTMVDDAVAGARAAFGQRQIDLQSVPVPMVRGDRDQLLRVVRNLITNACVHTAPERPILVRSFPDEHDVVVQVIDGGPGLPPEEAAHVFERFWRADKARTRARGGSGLGMSIVATLVRAHGGSVVFDSTVETGSTVTLRLPAAYDVVLEDPHD